MKRMWTLLTVVVLASLVLTACAVPVAAPAGAPAAAPAAAPAEGAAAPSGEVKDFITWYQYDEKNEDPASDERVGNQYLRDTIPAVQRGLRRQVELGEPAQGVGQDGDGTGRCCPGRR